MFQGHSWGSDHCLAEITGFVNASGTHDPPTIGWILNSQGSQEMKKGRMTGNGKRKYKQRQTGNENLQTTNI